MGKRERGGRYWIFVLNYLLLAGNLVFLDIDANDVWYLFNCEPSHNHGTLERKGIFQVTISCT